MAQVLIPKGFRRCAETFNQYKNCTVKVYHNAERGLCFIVVDDDVIGPFKAGQLETLYQTLTDVIHMKANIRYLE